MRREPNMIASVAAQSNPASDILQLRRAPANYKALADDRLLETVAETGRQFIQVVVESGDDVSSCCLIAKDAQRITVSRCSGGQFRFS